MFLIKIYNKDQFNIINTHYKNPYDSCGDYEYYWIKNGYHVERDLQPDWHGAPVVDFYAWAAIKQIEKPLDLKDLYELQQKNKDKIITRRNIKYVFGSSILSYIGYGVLRINGCCFKSWSFEDGSPVAPPIKKVLISDEKSSEEYFNPITFKFEQCNNADFLVTRKVYNLVTGKVKEKKKFELPYSNNSKFYNSFDVKVLDSHNIKIGCVDLKIKEVKSCEDFITNPSLIKKRPNVGGFELCFVGEDKFYCNSKFFRKLDLLGVFDLIEEFENETT